MRVTAQLEDLVKQALKDLGFDQKIEVQLEHPADPNHGDYSTNVAMMLFGQAKKYQGKSFKDTTGLKEDGILFLRSFKWKSSKDFAEALAANISDQIGDDHSLVSNVQVAGPGFINFTLSDQFYLSKMGEMIAKEGNVADQTRKGQKIVVEFTDPNPFKEFHIGHLYSNTVGESICRLLEAMGATVHRVNYFGDVGMHVAKSVWGMKKKLIEDQTTLEELEEQPLKQRVKFLGQAYALGASAYEEDKVVQAEVVEINYLTYLSSQESLQETIDWKPQVDYQQYLEKTKLDYQEIKQLYQTGREWSLDYFENIYQRLGMKFDDHYPESVVGEYGTKIVREGLKKGIFEKSQGAVVYKGEKQGLHTRVFINSMGLPTYETKELGLAPTKYKDFAYDQSLIVTGNEINEYFKVLLAAMSEVEPELAAKTVHLGHGMVRLPEGKMSSRTGKIITGEWLMDEAVNKAHTKIQKETKAEFSSDGSQVTSSKDAHVTPGKMLDTAEKVGLSAIKYAFLKSSVGGDITFSFDESLSFQGNSGPYLQYTYVRCVSVLEKVDVVNAANESTENRSITKYIDTLLNDKSYLDHRPNKEENDVLRNLSQYSEVLLRASSEFTPHYLCSYLFNLAQSFNVFYTQHQIVEKDDSKSKLEISAFRVLLTQSVAYVLKDGLKLLGIEVVDRM